MKKHFYTILLSVLLACFAFLLVGCSDNEPKNNLSDVLENKAPFISEIGTSAYLKDYKIGVGTLSIPIDAIPSKYVYVDLDNDGANELVVNISDKYGYYLVLHWNGQDVYGFEFNARSLLSLKTDGSFMRSNGAARNSYCKMSFDNNSYTIIDEAIKDSTAGNFELKGKNVSVEALNEFISNWNLKSNVEWKNIKVSEETDKSDTNVKDKINLNDYVSVRFDGKNLAGYAYVSFDREKFLLDNINNISFNQDNLQVYKELYGNSGKSAANDILEYVSVGLNKQSKLSNEDEIELVWRIDTEKLTSYFEWEYICAPQLFTVTGLEEAETFDPFEDFTINFSNIAPYGKANVYSYGPYNGNYKLSKEEGLSNGDIITVTYSCSDIPDMIERYGTYPSCYEKTYTVSGLKSFPRSIDDFSDKLLSDINVTADNYFSQFQEETISNYGMIVEKYDIVGYAFIAPTVNVGYNDSKFYAVYKVEAKATYEGQYQSTQYYVVLEFNNPIITDDICSMNTKNYSIPYHTTDAVVFSEKYHATYVSASGFNTKDEITQYLNNYISSRSELVFQTYQ